MEEADETAKRRRFSNLFNPREQSPKSSSSDSSLMEEDPDALNQHNPHDSMMVEPATALSDSIMEDDTEGTGQFNDSVIVEPVTLRRSNRKKTATNHLVLAQPASRPVKLTAKSSDRAIKDYYLDKKVKRTNPSLETIYEEPQVYNNEEVVMSTRKFKRMINFSAVPVKNSVKVKKRKAKAKTLKSKLKNKKVTLKHLMDKLREIDEDCH